MSALNIYRATLRARYAPDPQQPTKPEMVSAPESLVDNSVWTGKKPAVWITGGRIAPAAADEFTAHGAIRRYAETLKVYMLAHCTTSDWDDTEDSLTDLMLGEMAYIDAEQPVGIENSTVMSCTISRITIQESPSVLAVLEWAATTDVTDTGFGHVRPAIPADFRPDFLELHQLPEDIVTTIGLT